MNNKEQIALELTKIYWKDKMPSFIRDVKDTYDYFFNEVKIVEDTPKKITKLNEHIFVDAHSIVLKINEIIDKINGDDNGNH